MPAVMERDLLLPWVLLHIYGHYQSWGQRSHVSLQYLLKSFYPLEGFCTFIMDMHVDKTAKGKNKKAKRNPKKTFFKQTSTRAAQLNMSSGYD